MAVNAGPGTSADTTCAGNATGGTAPCPTGCCGVDGALLS